MPKKLQSFFILKLNTGRIKGKNYRVFRNLDEARQNGEIVRLGDSELLRAIRRVRGIEFSQKDLELLLEERKTLHRKYNTAVNKSKIQTITAKIDEMLYVKDLIILAVDDVRHYAKVIKEGLFVNGVEYKRLLCGAGHARRSTVLFANVEILDVLLEILNCGCRLDEEMNANKYNSYLGMASSATQPVTRPPFVVIPDMEVVRKIKVDYFVPRGDYEDPEFEEREIEQPFSLFDGQGLISPTQAQIWAEDLELDYTPSAFIFRAPFSKGLLVAFDFHNFAYQNGIKHITDIYGTEHHIDDIEVILSESQFKMAKAYDSLDDFDRKSRACGFGWAVGRTTPKQEKDVTTTTYQYLQAMNIDHKDIPAICEPTAKWLSSITGDDWRSALIFLLGELRDYQADDFLTADIIAKIIMLEPRALADSYVVRRLFSMVNRKIRDSYIGILKVPGNYQFVMGDPVAQAEHAFGLEVKGILPAGKVYSHYWAERGVGRISIFRSPMTWRSEQVVASVYEKAPDEFEHIRSGIIFNVYDDWLMRLSGADLDGDIIVSTPEFINYQYSGYNIPVYARNNAPKGNLEQEKLWKADQLSFGSKIGLITNLGTTFFSMLPMYGEEEQEVLINRLKACNVFQNMQIDKTKGIVIYDLPAWWDKWNKEGPHADMYNRLLARQRPYFMRYIYSAWNKRFKRHWSAYDNMAVVRLGISLANLLAKKVDELDDIGKNIVAEFYERTPLIDSACTMNIVCHHMEGLVKELKVNSTHKPFNYTLYMSGRDVELDEAKLRRMELLYQKYVAYLRNSHDHPEEPEDDEEIAMSRDEYLRVLEREAYAISNNMSELADLLVAVCYGTHGEASKDFCWRMFDGKGILANLSERSRGLIEVPVLDPNGDYTYLEKTYSMKTVDLKEKEL